MAIAEAQTRWLVLSGPLIFPGRLATILKGTVPRTLSTAQVRDAFLSFDIPGVPFLEPCYANVLVKGFNDFGDWSSAANGEKAEGRESDAYKRWIWSRCAPGVDFGGALPLELEGIALELERGDFETVIARAIQFLPTIPTVLVPVRTLCFEGGDLSRSSGEVRAELLVIQPKASAAGLQPSRKHLMLILRGAYLNVLSQPFLAQLTILRPMDLSPPAKTLSSRFYRLCLAPAFILFYLPSRVLGPLWAQVGGVLFGQGVPKLRVLERVARGLTGSGYWNEGRK